MGKLPKPHILYIYLIFFFSRKEGQILNNNTALFTEWDESLSDIVFIRSQNSMGRSVSYSKLRVNSPISSKLHQPTNLRYIEETYTFSWDPPTEQKNLIGYVIYWCNVSKINPRLCHEKEGSPWDEVPLSENQYHFPTSMYLAHLGVSADYSDQKSGGIQWINIHTYKSSYSGPGLSFFIIPVLIAVLVVLISYVYRRCRQMADIKVVLPESFEIMKSSDSSPAAIPIPGNFSPKAIVDISMFFKAKETPPADRQHNEESPYKSLENAGAAHVTESYAQNMESRYMTMDLDSSKPTGSYSAHPKNK